MKITKQLTNNLLAMLFVFAFACTSGSKQSSEAEEAPVEEAGELEEAVEESMQMDTAVLEVDSTAVQADTTAM